MENLNKMYDDPESMGDRAWLVCLNNVFMFGLHGVNMGKHEGQNKALISRFFYNAWIAFDDVALFLTPRLINVQALLTMAAVAQEISKPGLCWMLLCHACRLGQAIGLHRKSELSQFADPREYEERKWVFWNLYIMDKTLSMAFGRTICLPDSDIDVDYPAEDPSVHWSLFTGWVWLAKIQSQVYQRLYSATAIQISDEERHVAAMELDHDLRWWWTEKGKLLLKQQKTERARKYVEVELKFNFHNSLVTIHRVNRGGGDESARLCLESAREALSLIKDSIDKDGDTNEDHKTVLW
jgi:Fungal specific transcription factor domain